RDRYEVPQNVGHIAGRRRMQTRDLRIDHSTSRIRTTEDRVCMAIAESVTGAEFDKVSLIDALSGVRRQLLRLSWRPQHGSRSIGTGERGYVSRLRALVARLTGRHHQGTQANIRQTVAGKRHILESQKATPRPMTRHPSCRV